MLHFFFLLSTFFFLIYFFNLYFIFFWTLKLFFCIFTNTKLTLINYLLKFHVLVNTKCFGHYTHCLGPDAA
jgi:hypothetical protein